MIKWLHIRCDNFNHNVKLNSSIHIKTIWLWRLNFRSIVFFNIYHDIFEHFVWNKQLKIWKIRKKNQCVDRIYFMSFKIDSFFYLRLLLFNKKRCTSFENLRIVFVQIENIENEKTKLQLMKIYINVCVTLKLIDNDDE